jgi:hypothetical protein
VAVVLRNSDRQLVDVTSSVIWPQGIASSERLPFLAVVDSIALDFVIEPLVEATRADNVAQEALVVDEGPRLVVPPRGMPFLLGSARNQAAEPQWVRGVVTLLYRGEVLTLAEIRSPVPLGAGETLAFSLEELPGLLSALRADPDAASQIEITTHWDWPADPSPAPAPIPLELSIDSFEAIGETLVLRGAVRNPTPNPVTSPTTFAAVRTVRGKGIAAGWVPVAQMLAAEETAEVVLSLRLADAIEPTEMEFDVRAFGLSP